MCLSLSAQPNGQPQRTGRALQFAMAGLGASQGNPGAKAVLSQLQQNFRNNHGGMTVQQAVQARRARAGGTTTGGPPSITGG